MVAKTSEFNVYEFDYFKQEIIGNVGTFPSHEAALAAAVKSVEGWCEGDEVPLVGEINLDKGTATLVESGCDFGCIITTWAAPLG
jgi:hypothetical protein